MRPMKPIALILVLVAGTVSNQAAAEIERVSGSGDVYVVTDNEHGFVLTGKYPKTWQEGQGADTRYVEGKDVFYFGRSCDAFHSRYGEGTWSWANGGFGARFDSGFALVFARQDVPWDGGGACWE